MAGGYQITFGYGDCTLGFPTLRGNTAGMVTAGHCTEPLPYNGGVASGNQVHQPNSSAVANLIGHEDLDPTFSTSTGNCGDSDGCRYSDATFVDFTSGTQYTLGRIAKPTGDWTTTVDPDNSHYDVVSDTTYANSGDQVFKVGTKTTGATLIGPSGANGPVTGNRWRHLRGQRRREQHLLDRYDPVPDTSEFRQTVVTAGRRFSKLTVERTWTSWEY